MKFRKVLFWAHLSIGVIIGLVILNMAVTGMIMAFEPQIVRYVERKQQFVNITDAAAQRLSLDEIVSKVKGQYPDKKITQIGLKSDEKSSITVGFGREGSVYINPYTGEILGEDSQIHKLMHKIEDWHRYFGKKEIGKPITGAACLGFFLLILSGIYLWWPKQWQWKSIQAIIKFNPTLKGKARDWNWHNTIGFWCSPIFLVTTVTGLIMSYTWANNLLYRSTGNTPPPVQSQQKSETEKKVKENNDQPKASFDTLFQTAEKQVPSWVTMNIRLGKDDKAAVVISIQEPSVRLPNHRSQLTLDLFTAEVKKWEPFSELNTGRKARMWIKPIHTGQAWGIVGQMIMFIGACGATVLVWTGLSMALQRFNSWRKKKFQIQN
ncbi:MAG: PepSY domain-containing protein [Candidatus Omnitrophica bacterium]|nr:PepSY domain-containing protein [Candidatus Omnitrophota bacterium]